MDALEAKLERVAQVHEAADVVLAHLGVRLAKAIDLSTRDGFDLAVARLARQLGSATNQSDTQAVRGALGVLDVDWTRTTARDRARLIRQALEAAGRALRPGVRAVEARLGPAAEEVMEAARRGTRRRHGLAITADFNTVDRRMIKYLRQSETSVVRDAYGRRLDDFSRLARGVVADGLELGLGRADIAANLEHAARTALTGRTRFYWETVAGAFTARARSYGALSAFAEARIDRYRIEAVLDERTTAVCRFMHGKEFTVRAGLDAFRRAESQPERLKEVSPWLREGRDMETGRRVLYVKRGDSRLHLAEEVRSGVGARDDVGEFRVRRGDIDPTAAGCLFPAFHGGCRSSVTTV